MTAEGDAVSISAALWKFSEGRQFELQGVPDPLHHIVSLPSAGRHRCTYFGNGRERFSGEPTPFRMNLVHAGEVPSADLRTETTTEYLHIYVPHRFLQELVERAPRRPPVGLELCAHAKELDPVIAQIGQSVLSEMERQDSFSRLRVDALGLDLGVHLLRRHSSLSGGPAGSLPGRSGGLAPWQLKRVCARMQGLPRSRVFGSSRVWSTSAPSTSAGRSVARPDCHRIAGWRHAAWNERKPTCSIPSCR